MAESSSEFLALFWRSPDRANLCTLTLLAWLSTCDGPPSDEEDAFLRRIAVAGNSGEIDMILAVAQAARLEDMETVCRYAMTRLSRGRKRLLAQLAITLAATSGYITVGENYAMQFLADLLAITPRAFAKLFQQVTRRPFPEAGDPSSIEWWRRREAGVQAEPAHDLRPDPSVADAKAPEATVDAESSTQSAPPAIPANAPMTHTKARAILGLSEGATLNDIRTAFRRLAKVRHPDRFAKLGPSAVAAASESFKQLDAAYTMLKEAA